MIKQISEDEAMHITGVIPIARLNHLPIDYKKYKKTKDGCLEYKTKIKFKDNSVIAAIYHQWKKDVEEIEDLDELTWIPSWYEYKEPNK